MIAAAKRLQPKNSIIKFVIESADANSSSDQMFHVVKIYTSRGIVLVIVISSPSGVCKWAAFTNSSDDY